MSPTPSIAGESKPVAIFVFCLGILGVVAGAVVGFLWHGILTAILGAVIGGLHNLIFALVLVALWRLMRSMGRIYPILWVTGLAALILIAWFAR